MPLRQIGDLLGISRERVRQLEHEALEKLRRILEKRR
jgi:DNA-directed RNA polymerase sigma subunit (sigma70/sigma32)